MFKLTIDISMRKIKLEVGCFTNWVLQSTPDNSNQQGKSKKVRVIGSLRQIAGSKEISKWMGIAKYAGMDTDFELE